MRVLASILAMFLFTAIAGGAAPGPSAAEVMGATNATASRPEEIRRQGKEIESLRCWLWILR
jgi:hypothetical protein